MYIAFIESERISLNRVFYTVEDFEKWVFDNTGFFDNPKERIALVNFATGESKIYRLVPNIVVEEIKNEQVIKVILRGSNHA